MIDFAASNGVAVEVHADGLLVVIEPAFDQRQSIHPNNVSALGEFFQAQTDERLGLWRSKAHPEYVVSQSDQFRDGETGSWVSILHERSHFAREASRSTTTSELDFRWPQMHFGAVAREFFDAHPEPKAWHKAAPGEIWDVDLSSGGMRAVTHRSTLHGKPSTVFRDAHTQAEIRTDDPDIRDARCLFSEARGIWPEVLS